ncbi:MAG: hypothetical protein ACPG4U_05460 [Pseudomonadales bacterium]
MKKAIAFALVLAAPVSFAQEKKLEGAQINDLFTGHTLNGVHYNKRTLQYFSPTGLTLWIGEGDAAPSEGKWKVENDQYCSDFGSGWGCYDIVNDAAQGVHYFIGEDFRAPFIVKQGYQLRF